MLWSSGGFSLRPLGGARVDFDSPFAVIGRARAGRWSLGIDDPAVSSRHVYLHLDDRRGLFAVDLATRTGTRVGPPGAPSGWLEPGDRIEVGGHQVEVVEVRRGEPVASAATLALARRSLSLTGPPPTLPFGPPAPDSPLDDAGDDAPIVRLTLFPEAAPGEPLALNSELVFVGRSPSCAVTVDGDSAMRVQCVLVRAPEAAYVVDLVGRGTWRNGRPVNGAERLVDGDSLMVGASRYNCRVEPAGSPPMSRRSNVPALSLGVGSPAPAGPSLAAFAALAEPDDEEPLDLAPVLQSIPAEARAAVLGWMMNEIQRRQDRDARRHAQFQTDLVRLVAEIHRDNHAVLQRHMERADEIRRELGELREELKKRLGAGAGAAGESASTPSAAALDAPRPSPLRIAPVAPPEDPEAAASYLIGRINQLDQESRSNWRDLLARLSGRKAD